MIRMSAQVLAPGPHIRDLQLEVSIKLIAITSEHRKQNEMCEDPQQRLMTEINTGNCDDLETPDETALVLSIFKEHLNNSDLSMIWPDITVYDAN